MFLYEIGVELKHDNNYMFNIVIIQQTNNYVQIVMTNDTNRKFYLLSVLISFYKFWRTHKYVQ